MAIKQLTVFVENRQGTIVSVTDTLSQNEINLRALSVAETKDFGILRIIVNDVESAAKILSDEGYLLKITEVVGIKIADEPGNLSKALKVLNDNEINMEYLYAFMAHTQGYAYVVIRVEDNEASEKALTDAGFELITDADVCEL